MVPPWTSTFLLVNMVSRALREMGGREGDRREGGRGRDGWKENDNVGNKKTRINYS